MKKQVLHAFIMLIMLCVVTVSHAAAQQSSEQSSEQSLSLNGLAVHSKLRNDLYMAALYTEIGSSDAQMLLESDQNKRMELRVLAKRWSARGFAEHWNQALIINNSEDDLAKFAREVRRFTSAVRGKLVPGDRITIDYRSKQYTRLYVDGVRLLSVKKDPQQFFQLLLRCWIGPRPPSTEFKQNILNLPTGDEGSGLLARYEALLPVSGRKNIVMAWREGNSQAAALAAIRAAEPAASKPAGQRNAPVKTATAQDKPQIMAAQPNPDSKPESARPDRAASIAAALNAPKTTAGNVAGPAAALPDIAADAAPTGRDDKAPVSLPQAGLSEPAESTDAEPVILEQTAKAALPGGPEQQNNGLLNLYKSNLLKRVYGFVIYPERAIDRNQEGTVVLQVTVNRKGKVLSIKNDEPSRYRLLNSAATRAIKKASPFPAAPRKLKGNTFDIEFPIVFRLPRS